MSIEQETEYLPSSVELEKNDSYMIKHYRRKKKEDTNLNFIQMYNDDKGVFLSELKKVGASATLTMHVLVHTAFQGHCNLTEYAYVILSLNSLTALTGLTKPTVMSAIKTLESNNFLKIFKSGQTNVYAINPNKYWKSSKNKKSKALYYKDDLVGYIVRGNIVIEQKISKSNNNPFLDIDEGDGVNG